jgi:hypothetical protein
MMGGVAFILLNAGRRWPESPKQAKIRLAKLLKILHIARFEGPKKGRWQGTGATGNGCIGQWLYRPMIRSARNSTVYG